MLLSGTHMEGEKLQTERVEGLDLFIDANVMRMNWSNAAASGLWASMPASAMQSTVLL